MYCQCQVAISYRPTCKLYLLHLSYKQRQLQQSSIKKTLSCFPIKWQDQKWMSMSNLEINKNTNLKLYEAVRTGSSASQIVPFPSTTCNEKDWVEHSKHWNKRGKMFVELIEGLYSICGSLLLSQFKHQPCVLFPLHCMYSTQFSWILAKS